MLFCSRNKINEVYIHHLNYYLYHSFTKTSKLSLSQCVWTSVYSMNNDPCRKLSNLYAKYMQKAKTGVCGAKQTIISVQQSYTPCPGQDLSYSQRTVPFCCTKLYKCIECAFSLTKCQFPFLYDINLQCCRYWSWNCISNDIRRESVLQYKVT